MPRHFTDEEREQLRKKLLSSAKKLFLQYGLNKTTVSDITDEAKIGKGTFYSFFNCKGDIYLQLYAEEWTAVHDKMDRKYKNRKGPIDEIILDYIYENRKIVSSHPILSTVHNRNALALISEPTVTEQLYSFKELSDSRLTELIKSWFITNDIQTGVKPETVSGMMRSLSYLNYHKDEIGEDIFNDVIRNFAEGITYTVHKK